jgi:Bacterial PH domain
VNTQTQTTPDIVPDGLPDHLPEGEHMLWQGSPDWKRLAIDAFHVRKVAIYFAGVIALQAAYRLPQSSSAAEAFANAPVLIACAAAACSILAFIAYLSAKTTRYTLTNKRALMRIGITLPITVNVPYGKVDGVSFANTGDDCGTICFKPGNNVRLAYLMLWPHAKPWNFSKPQPAFRDIADVDAVASRLASLLGGRMPAPQPRAAVPQPDMIPAE